MKAHISKGAIRLIAENELDGDIIRKLCGRTFIGGKVISSTKSGFGEVYLDETKGDIR